MEYNYYLILYIIKKVDKLILTLTFSLIHKL